MTPETIAQLGLAINAARFLISQDLRTTANSIREFFASRFGAGASAEDQEVLLSQDGIDYIASLRTISVEILEYVAEEIDKAEQAYIVCLKSATTRGARNSCDRDAENIICEALERSKLRNSGVLPEPFVSVWGRYGCK